MEEQPQRHWLIPFAIGTASLMAIPALWSRTLCEAAIALASISYVFAAVMYLLPRVKRRRYNDPYDLNALKEFHEQAELDSVEAVFEGDGESIVCPQCGNVCNARFGTCPSCCNRLR